MTLGEALWGVRCVWLRYFDVFRKSLAYYLVTTFVEPFFYLLAFGFGVGALVGSLQTAGHSVSYRSFVFSGILGQTLLFQGFYEASYGGFVRMYYQRIFQAIAVTPITLSEVLWGDMLWDATKATVAVEMIAAIGVATGDFPLYAPLAVLPVAVCGSLLFSGMGLAVAARSRTIEEISYPQYLLVFPMFLFCGVFFPVESLPHPLQWIAWALPLTAINSLLRTLTLGLPFVAAAPAILLAWLAVLVVLGRRAMFRRLVK